MKTLGLRFEQQFLRVIVIPGPCGRETRLARSALDVSDVADSDRKTQNDESVAEHFGGRKAGAAALVLILPLVALVGLYVTDSGHRIALVEQRIVGAQLVGDLDPLFDSLPAHYALSRRFIVGDNATGPAAAALETKIDAQFDRAIAAAEMTPSPRRPSILS